MSLSAVFSPATSKPEVDLYDLEHRHLGIAQVDTLQPLLNCLAYASKAGEMGTRIASDVS